MICPRCRVDMEVERTIGIDEVDRCLKCGGMWLDHHELEQLEDTAISKSNTKGTMMMRSFGSDLLCPHCETTMKWFRYRRYNLEIDFCEGGHGYWLDKGEEKRVLDIMRERNKGLSRSVDAQVQWERFLGRLGKRSFIDKVKELFRG